MLRSWVLLLALLIVGCSGAEQPRPPVAEPGQAAREGLQTLQKLVNAQNFRAMGFDSQDEVKSAALGPQLPVFNVGLEQVKTFTPGSDPNAVLTQSSETIYPVTVSGQVKSSITIVKKENGFQPASFGNADIVKRLARYREADTTGDLVVRVPWLNLFFLGRKVENQLVLIPILDDSRVNLKEGTAIPAQVLFEQLVPLAKEYNGLPT